MGLGEPVVQIRQLGRSEQETLGPQDTSWAEKSHAGVRELSHLWADLNSVPRGGTITLDPGTGHSRVSLWEGAEKAGQGVVREESETWGRPMALGQSEAKPRGGLDRPSGSGRCLAAGPRREDE